MELPCLAKSGMVRSQVGAGIASWTPAGKLLAYQGSYWDIARLFAPGEAIFPSSLIVALCNRQE